MKCITCQHLDILRFPTHARGGMGKCTAIVELTGTFVSTLRDRECKYYKEALPATVRAREVFINGGT